MDTKQKIAQLQARQAQQLQKATLILNAAERESRGLTDDEKKELAALEKSVDSLAAQIEQVEGDADFTAELRRLEGGTGRPSPDSGRHTASWGQQFIQSDTFKWLRDTKSTRAGMWTSPASELMATTIDESSGSGGQLVVPQYQPGILPVPTRPLVVADLLSPGSTESNTVTYMKEDSYTNAAATVSEGAAKPESAIVFSAVSESVRKIAHWIPVTDEILEDVPQMSSHIDGRLRLGVQLTEDDQLLNGDGNAPNLKGLMNRTGLATTVARGSDTNADAILNQIAAISSTALVMPDGIIMHPTNWLAILKIKTANGDYYGDGPFRQLPVPRLWGLPIALTPAITLNTALVGAFKIGAQFFRKGGIRVEASNSHQDFFTKNLVAIRAEERGALAVYRPAAIGKVTGLT